MSWSAFFSSQLFGIILGAILTTGFTWFLEFIRAKREEKTHLKRKREDLYEKLYDLLMRLEKDIRIRKNTFISKETKEFYNELEQHTIWASKKVSESFYNLSNDIFNSAEEYEKDKDYARLVNTEKILKFKELLRKEVSIKD